MANTLITPDQIAREGLVQLHNMEVMAACVHKEYVDEFRNIGEKVRIRRPVKFAVASGKTLQVQDIEQGTVELEIQHRRHVAWALDSKDLTLSIEQYSEQLIEPAMISIAQQVELDLLQLTLDVPDVVGSWGVVPGDYAAIAAATRRLREKAVPSDGRLYGVLDPEAVEKITATATGLFVRDIADEAYRRGDIGAMAGLNIKETQNILRHLRGTAAGSGAVDVTAAHASTYADWVKNGYDKVNTDGWTNATTLKKGDVFTIDGVFDVNPVPGKLNEGKQAYNRLKQFVVYEDVTLGNNVEIKFNPAIITSGPQQTCSAPAANDAAITVFGTGAALASEARAQNLAFHRNAFAMVSVPIKIPRAIKEGARKTRNHTSVRVIFDYDRENDEEVVRFDVMYGTKAIYPDLATRLTG